MSVLSLTVFAEDYGNFSYTLVEPGDGEDFSPYIQLTYYNESDEGVDNVVDLPSEIDNDPVTVINPGAFRDKMSVQEFVLPDTLERVENSAFKGSAALKAVVIPDSVTYIGDSAFQDCTALEYVYIGKGVKEIGDVAFKNCTNLKYVALGSSLEKLGNGAFYGCTALTELYVPSSVNTIEKLALGMTETNQKAAPVAGFTIYTDSNKAAADYAKASGVKIENGIKVCSENGHDVSLVNVRTASDSHLGFDAGLCSKCHTLVIADNDQIPPAEPMSVFQWIVIGLVVAGIVVFVIFVITYVLKSKKRRAEAIEAYKAGKPLPDLKEKEAQEAKIAAKKAKKRAKQEAKLASYREDK